MGRITLAGSLPAENHDGLTQSSKDFMDMPLELVDVVARVAVVKITEKPETGERYPTLRIHHWEIVGGEHSDAFKKIIQDQYMKRTGMLELPFPDGEVPMKEDPFPEEEAS